MRRSLPLLVAITLAAPLSGTALAQDPAAFYEEHCAACHTIGRGVEGGPDLKGVTARRDRDWLVRFLLDPEAFAKDPAVVQMIKEADGLEMGPTEGLTREIAEDLLDYIDQQSAAMSPGAASGFAPFTAEEASRGRLLFAGAVPLSSRGPACVACHTGGDVAPFNGGRFGTNLAGVSERLGGGRGLTAWLKATPTPMMHALYRNARITDDEARALAAFMETPAAPGTARRAAAPHVLGGVAGGLLVMWVIGMTWSQRFRAVRRPMVEASAHKGLTHRERRRVSP